MKLNAYILRDYMKIPVLKSSLVSDRNACQIGSIAFFRPNRTPERDQVTILFPEQLQSLPDVPGTFLCIGEPKAALSKRNALQDILYVDEKNDPISVFEDLQALFQTFYSWENCLNHLIIAKAPLKEFGDCSLPFLCNPITLYSANHRNIFASERVLEGGLPMFQSADINAYLPDDDLDEMRIDPEFAESILKMEPTIFSDHIWGYRILFQNIRLSGVFVARLMALETTRPLKDSDFPILKILADHVCLALQQTDLILNGHPKDFDNLIYRLLNREQLPEQFLSDTLGRLDWHDADLFFCAAITINERDRATNSLVSECVHLECNLPGSIAVPLDQNVLLVSNLTAGQVSREDILSKLAYILRESLLKAGISMQFRHFSSLADYYQQASDALETGNMRNPTYWCHQYETHALAILLQKARSGASHDSLIPSGLRALMEYDLQNHRSYTNSLQTFLENDRNIAESCRLLYLHRATFLYHLKRIREITGYNLDDSSLRLYLRVIFAILKQDNVSV